MCQKTITWKMDREREMYFVFEIHRNIVFCIWNTFWLYFVFYMPLSNTRYRYKNTVWN